MAGETRRFHTLRQVDSLARTHLVFHARVGVVHAGSLTRLKNVGFRDDVVIVDDEYSCRRHPDPQRSAGEEPAPTLSRGSRAHNLLLLRQAVLADLLRAIEVSRLRVDIDV